MSEANHRKAPLRVLVALASYGTSNDCYLELLLREYHSMVFDIDIVIVSNIEKRPAPNVECLVGLPNRNPWSLPFAHKKLFAKHAHEYDLFVYSEDDILITQRNLQAFLDVTEVLQADEIAGFLRIEKGLNGEENFPDVHAYFHWDPASVRSRGHYTVAHFTNEHAACYVLTKAQLRTAIESGGFLVEPHEDKYDLICTAATDPYTQCGFRKLIPVSHILDFTVHHLSNKYINSVGVKTSELREQIDAIVGIAKQETTSSSLFNTETKLPGALYSKDYYEPVSESVISAIPKRARTVLSVGCGWGATERILVERGLRVIAMPLDSIISRSAAAQGVEMTHGSIDDMATLLLGKKFDCVLCLNILHLAADPATVLRELRGFLSVDSTAIIQSPNMMSLRAIRELYGSFGNRPFRREYSSTGAHFSSPGKLKNWCSASGMKIDRMEAVFDPPEVSTLGRISAAIGNLLPASLRFLVAPSFVIAASGAQIDHKAVSTRSFHVRRRESKRKAKTAANRKTTALSITNRRIL
jgi:2-polyprenyl-3-methyl-5-hydroxy-6-metoxy-1,4-benzoquinol methylase